MEKGTVSYSNDEIRVLWKPALCIHSGICLVESPAVFNSLEKPWINMNGASTSEIIETVKKCPSGALSFKYKNEELNELKSDNSIKSNNEIKISLLQNGPAIINGDTKIILEDGTVVVKKGITVLCRCNKTKNHPFCDGSHSE